MTADQQFLTYYLINYTFLMLIHEHERKFIRLRTTASYVAYKAARATANEFVTRSRGQFIANEVADASGNPRSLRRTVNRLLHHGVLYNST